jgi:hypothetical protein
MGRELLTAYGRLLLEVVTALTVESGSPDALCPELAQTREAVAARLGTMRVTRAGWRARYTIGHAPDSTGGDFVRLEVFDPDGFTRLQRDLPMTGRSCLDMSQALALVLDRYFRTLTAEPAETAGTTEQAPSVPAPAPNTARYGETGPSASPANAAASTGVRQSAEAEPRPPQPQPRSPARRWLLANAGVAIAARPSSAGVSVGIATEPVPRFEIGVGGVALLAKQRQQTEQGTVSQQSFPLRAWSTYSVIQRGLELKLGPEWLGAVEFGQSVDGRQTEPRLLWGIGARASVRGWANPRIGFGVTGSLDITLANGRFLVGSEEVLAPGPVQGLVALDVTWLALP